MTPFESLLRNLWNLWQKSQYYTSQSAAVILHIYLLVKLELASNRCKKFNLVKIQFWRKLNFLRLIQSMESIFPIKIFCHLLSRITFIEFLSQSYRNMYYFSLLLKFENRGIWTLIMNFKMTDNLRSVIVFQLELDQLDEKITGTGYAI